MDGTWRRGDLSQKGQIGDRPRCCDPSLESEYGGEILPSLIFPLIIKGKFLWCKTKQNETKKTGLRCITIDELSYFYSFWCSLPTCSLGRPHNLRVHSSGLGAFPPRPAPGHHARGHSESTAPRPPALESRFSCAARTRSQIGGEVKVNVEFLPLKSSFSCHLGCLGLSPPLKMGVIIGPLLRGCWED